MYIRRYVHMFVILVTCVCPREHGWEKWKNQRREQRTRSCLELSDPIRQSYVCISLNVMVVARLCTLQCSCQRKRLAFTTIAATYVTSILVLALVPNYWVSALMAANM